MKGGKVEDDKRDGSSIISYRILEDDAKEGAEINLKDIMNSDWYMSMTKGFSNYGAIFTLTKTIITAVSGSTFG